MTSKCEMLFNENLSHAVRDLMECHFCHGLWQYCLKGQMTNDEFPMTNCELQ
jgi:hypothetical protein